VQLRDDATLEIWDDTDHSGREPDEVILQCAADLTNLQPDSKVRVLTGDINMRLRAEQMGLAVMQLPEDHRKKGTALDNAPSQV